MANYILACIYYKYTPQGKLGEEAETACIKFHRAFSFPKPSLLEAILLAIYQTQKPAIDLKDRSFRKYET
jgi:hypothetical protein